MKQAKSKRLFRQAQQYLPGGVDSPVRAFKAVGGTPPFIKRGLGSRLHDEDGNEFIDYVCSWGALILGHAHPAIVAALQDAAERGASYGAPTALEVQLARLICGAMPSIEMLRFVNSGTEATMSALRVARAFTGRDKIVKFEGCYHGHSDGLLAKAGSGAMTLGLPGTPGVPASYTRETLVAPYNDLRYSETLFHTWGKEIAAVIVEPVAANMGVVLPAPDFLPGLRRLTAGYGSLLIFDEVITGFRVAYGGAQAIYNITPDLTCLGKIIGGGLPVGAYGGRKDIMSMIAPLGPVYQAGTLSGNPLAMTAGIAALKILSRPGVYDRLEEKAALLEKGFQQIASHPARLKPWATPPSETGKQKLIINRTGSLLTLFFADKPVTDYASAKAARTDLYGAFFHRMLERGVYLPPSQFEALFVSTAHTRADIQQTLEAAEQSIVVSP
ncbi:MAG: glutamate-1-semialdehyde 2,1-aminomutase [Chloroflexi bacterium]|nr:glutamate-1-semialdehyde 2,1-aminomutase [Chloroflexota bacterium]